MHNITITIYISIHWDILSTNIYGRDITSNVRDPYQRSNLFIIDFRVCDCIKFDSLFNTYCMHMYGCEL